MRTAAVVGAVLGAVLAVVGAVLPEVVRVDGYSASYLSGVCGSGLGTLAQALDAKVHTDCSELAALNDVAHGLLAVGIVVLLASSPNASGVGPTRAVAVGPTSAVTPPAGQPPPGNSPGRRRV